MLRRLVVVVGVAALFTAAAVGPAVAQNACDGALTKLAAKKVKCIDGVISKAQKTGNPTNTTKIDKCKAKFAAKCTTVGCATPNHLAGCSSLEDAADTAANNLSPSGAFLNAGGGLF